jgi:hypothetical protein
MDHMGRAIVGLLSTLLFFGLLLAIGGGIYQAGVAQGIVDAGRVPAGAVVGVAGYGYGWGFHPFGFLGLLFPLFILLLFLGFLRAVFGRGRGWSHRHGDSHGWYGKGYGPAGWREEREHRMAELHRRLHEEEAARGGGASTSSDAPGSSGAAPAPG